MGEKIATLPGRERRSRLHTRFLSHYTRVAGEPTNDLMIHGEGGNKFAGEQPTSFELGGNK